MGSIDRRDVMSLKLLKINKVSEITGLGRSTIYARVAEETFPKPIKLGHRASAWVESEIEAWIETRIAISRGGSHE
jgi:prophage regulatory protein